MTRQEQALWFVNLLRMLAIAIAAFGIAAVIYHVLKNLLVGKEGKLSKKQARRQARKAAKASHNAGQGRKRQKY
jgi:hypothetical protein